MILDPGQEQKHATHTFQGADEVSIDRGNGIPKLVKNWMTLGMCISLP